MIVMPDPIIREHLLTASFDSRALTSVQVHEIRFSPGQKAALHSHPCPVVGYILEGTALLQIDGEEQQVIHAGQAFYEPASTRILHFDNHSDTGPLLFVAFYLLNGRQSLIEFIYN
jgi:quercetin dioxygenase-like cupin family protein